MVPPRTTVYFDGACPLCRREMALLHRLDKKKRLLFRDISPPQATAFCPLPREDMLARFHVRRSDGVIFDGAAAFLIAYAQIPGLAWLSILAKSAIARGMFDVFYAVFLKIRPSLQWVARRFEGAPKKH